MPFLKAIKLEWDNIENKREYPFNIPCINKLNYLNTDHDVTFFIGENGTGKSTFIEGIAYKCGFNVCGGGKNNLFGSADASARLADIMTLSWLPKVNKGFFMRAETFFDFAEYLDDMAKSEGAEVYLPYGGKSLNEQSHGESFLSLFTNRFGLSSNSIYILDEPEAALSPQRQLAFLRVIHELKSSGKAQFIIATHSPILMAYPEAAIYSFDGGSIERIEYEATEHYQLTKAFLNNRNRFLEQIFED